MATHIIDLDADPFIPKGYKVERHVRGGKFVYDPTMIVPFLSQDQTGSRYTLGFVLQEELKGHPVFNGSLLDFWLAHPELIPPWLAGTRHNAHCWGTAYQEDVEGGGFYIPFIHHNGTEWIRKLRNFYHAWDATDLAILRATP